VCVCDLMGDAGDEIERLRARIVELDGFIKTIEEQATALEEENARLNNEIKQATAFLNDVTAEMADAREEIREMNGRIDNLHWRGRLWPTTKI
jgi:chromosome segregation ATPase